MRRCGKSLEVEVIIGHQRLGWFLLGIKYISYI